ncbi:hypothetical protein Acsp06_20570 [Actinomycetospora sp. NBRC 106375]|nr:hypothetical protein Acsp06_20570 [Actinomycetospora sp. NBRC 106375]
MFERDPRTRSEAWPHAPFSPVLRIPAKEDALGIDDRCEDARRLLSERHDDLRKRDPELGGDGAGQQIDRLWRDILKVVGDMLDESAADHFSSDRPISV